MIPATWEASGPPDSARPRGGSGDQGAAEELQEQQETAEKRLEAPPRPGLAITSGGRTAAVWGEGPSYFGPGGVWFNRQT